jgi:hypothetical protein
MFALGPALPARFHLSRCGTMFCLHLLARHVLLAWHTPAGSCLQVIPWVSHAAPCLFDKSHPRSIAMEISPKSACGTRVWMACYCIGTGKRFLRPGRGGLPRASTDHFCRRRPCLQSFQRLVSNYSLPGSALDQFLFLLKTQALRWQRGRSASDNAAWPSCLGAGADMDFTQYE